MHYNVARLLKEPVGSTRTYGISESVHADDGDAFIFPQGQLSLMRTDKGVWVEAKVVMKVLVSCSRCLKIFPYPVNVVIQEEYLPTVDINTGQSLHVPEREEGSFTIDQRHILDLTEALRQYAITNQPMKPLCYQDCLGLCHICGADRNSGSCSCEEETADPRWATLLKLKEHSIG
ncbi:MAG: DUF177 domain-containing protein [Dehalococcoidia bacterium]|nr:DUF177 domain-containing protein [Dehalococcoidia bacterium]